MVQIQNEFLTLKIDPYGAQMTELRSHSGTQYLWSGDKAYWGECAPVLFPYVARQTDGCYSLHGKRYSMGIHGFAKRSMFTMNRLSESSVTLCLKENADTLKEYPFRFTFLVSYTLQDSGVEILYSVRNENDIEMPFGIGGHPGFRVPLADGTVFEDYKLLFPEPSQPDRIGFTEAAFLDGTRMPYPLENGTTIHLRHDLFDNDAIVLQNAPREVTICSDKTKRSVTVAYPKMPYIGFWHKPHSDAPYVCIEPWVSLPSRQDIVEELSCKSDLIRLAPGEIYENAWTIHVTDD